MDKDARARHERDRGLQKVSTGTRWLTAGAAAAVVGFSGGLALPHVLTSVQDGVDTTSGSASDAPAAQDPATADVPTTPPAAGSSSGAIPPTTSRATPPTTSGSLTPPSQAPSAPRRRSHSVTGAS